MLYRNVNSYYPNDYSEYLQFFIKALKTYITDTCYDSVVIFSCDYEFDMSDNQVIYNSIKKTANVSFNYCSSVDEICKLIAESTAVITSRLHVAVVADIFNVPFLLLNYRKKMKRFVEKNKKYILWWNMKIYVILIYLIG